jgi:hypothetical protein
MNRKKIIFGTSGVAVVAAVFMLSNISIFENEATYLPQDLSSFEKQTASDAQKWLEARYLDLATGEKITAEKLNLLLQEQKKLKRASLVFEELGPDNIGGRTRALQIDRVNTDKIWAGGVSGGLFYSSNAGNNWGRVDDFPGAPYISSMTQTENLTVFVATGSNEEQWAGNGLFYKTPNATLWQTVPGTSNITRITEVVAADAGNKVYFATSTGLKSWTIGDAAITSITSATGIVAGSCNALVISKDGQVIATSMGSSNKVCVSTNAGSNFTDFSGTSANFKVPIGSPRLEFAISLSKNSANKYSIYAIRTNSNLAGMNVSHDNGQTWNQFIGSSGTPSNLDIYRDQGTYNSIASVDPRNPERLLLGGIDIWEWKQTVSNPPAGGFEQLSQWFLDPTSPNYVHADNHEMKWDKNDRLVIGNDGGISISTDYAANFYPSNRGYNVTQFYGIAMDKNGAVMGGTQDNGTLYNDFSGNSYYEFAEVTGGDGFECEISFFNPNVMFSSIYYNAIYRSGDRGLTFGSFEPPFPATYGATGTASAAFPFHTEFMLAEYFDTNSEDSVTYMPRKNHTAGSVVRVSSLSTGDTIDYITPTALYFDDTVFANSSLTRTDYKVVNGLTGNTIDLGYTSYTTIFNASGPVNPPAIGDTLLINGTNKVFVSQVTPYQHYFAKNPATNEVVDLREDDLGFNVSWDTIRVADPFQSWFIVYAGANNGEIWGTRDALRLSDAAPKWVQLATGLGFGSFDVEFSRDLNKCYISCGSKVYRIDGLGSLYKQSATFISNAQALGAAKLQISSANCEGIALNPNNANDLILLQGFSGTISRSSNAAGANPTFTNLTSLGVGAYDAIIDRANPQVIVVGTAFGVRVSENGGGSWDNASGGFENVPVFEVRQNWRSWAEGCRRPGEIYLGTFGRGIWASSSLMGLDDNSTTQYVSLKTSLKVYPNPTTDQATISFNNIKNGAISVRIYNLAGVLVKSIDLKNVDEGAQGITIDASSFNTGTYIVKLSANNTSETVKFVKL